MEKPVSRDRTWLITTVTEVTTMAGWKPDNDDVQDWLDKGGLHLVRIEKIEESK